MSYNNNVQATDINDQTCIPLTSKEFCEKFGIQSYIEQIIKHYEYRDMSDNIVVEYDKKEDGLWYNTTIEKLLKEIAEITEELTNEQKL